MKTQNKEKKRCLPKILKELKGFNGEKPSLKKLKT